MQQYIFVYLRRNRGDREVVQWSAHPLYMSEFWVLDTDQARYVWCKKMAIKTMDCVSLVARTITLMCGPVSYTANAKQPLRTTFTLIVTTLNDGVPSPGF